MNATDPGTIDDERHPRHASGLLGHEDAEKTLKNAFDSEKLAHSWLISGPRGIGKATLAYRFARYVLKHSKRSAEDDLLSHSTGLFGDSPDLTDNPENGGDSLYVAGDDPVFQRIAARGHADLLGIERGWQDERKNRLKPSIAVDDVRKAGGFLRLTSGEGGWRVVIVDAADDMTPNAANALLKVLEEPPARALLLLVSHSPGRLLPTIRSRCRRLALKPLSDTHVSRLLVQHLPDMDDSDRQTLMALSDGSIGRALELADKGGLEAHAALKDLLADFPKIDTVKLHKLGDRLARTEAEPAFRATRELLLGTLSNVIKCAAAPEYRAENTADAFSQRLASLSTLDRWLEVWEKVTHLMERADGANLDRKQVVLNVFHALGQIASR